MLVAALLLAPGAQRSGAAQEARPDDAFRVEDLAPGIRLLRPVRPGWRHTNALVVDRADGLLVVESQPSPDAAREFLGQLARLDPRPIRYLVLSHPHAESAGGASAFPPETLVIGSVGCHDAMVDPEHDFGAEQRARADAPAAWSEPPRRPPTLALLSNAVLHDPKNPVRLSPLQPAHSPGDLLVELPAAGVLYLGSIVFPDRNPWAKGASTRGWVATLNNLLGHEPRSVVVLRGGVVDASAVRQSRDCLAWIRGQVDFGFVEQLTAEQIPGQVMGLPDLGQYFDLEASPSFARQMVDTIIQEVVLRQKRLGGL
jgi:glyoxylase-like metal-dependent hydrolase (beta-lactamase superfamily II)